MVAIHDFLGQGIYSLSDASMLTNTSKTTINNWIKGYKRKDIQASPVITTDFTPIENFYAISFLDLMELFFVNAFRKHGVSLKTIRKAYNRAKETIGFDHPFSTLKFKTDGKSILAEIDDALLLNIINDQYAIKKILDPFLKDVFEFDNRIIHRFWPLGKERQIVIDPKRSFGRPIVNKENVPVEALFNAYKAEKSINKVASWFEVSNESVEDAVEYYLKLAA